MTLLNDQGCLLNVQQKVVSLSKNNLGKGPNLDSINKVAPKKYWYKN